MVGTVETVNDIIETLECPVTDAAEHAKAMVSARQLQKGDKVILTFTGMHGEFIKFVEIMSSIEQHGWNMPSGGWHSLSQGFGDLPAYRIGVREKHRRKSAWLRLDNLVHVEKGWRRTI